MLLDSNILIYGANGDDPHLDAIIAATALVHGLELVTQNVEDFQHIAGLQVRDPFARSVPE